MSRTNIAWTHRPGTVGETWNLVGGCEKTGPGCDNCWAIGQSWRMMHSPHPKVRELYEGTVRKDSKGRLHWTGKINTVGYGGRLYEPLRWRKPRTCFPCSMGDLFHHRVSDGFILDAFRVMIDSPLHVFQVLTKRAWRMPHFFASHQADLLAPKSRSHIWLGVSVEDQIAAIRRVPELRKTPTRTIFVSMEPLLGEIDATSWFSGYEMIDKTSPSGKQLYRCRQCGDETPAPCKYPYHDCLPGVSWGIIGCESGHNRRLGAFRTVDDWLAGAISLVNQFHDAGLPVFVKQIPIVKDRRFLDSGWQVSHDPSEWPPELQYQDFPG